MKKKSRVKIICGIILSVLVAIGLGVVLHIHYNSPDRLAMKYLYNHTKPSGRFVYSINVNPNVKYGNAYNEIRHAGVLYSMYLYERINKNTVLKDKRILASKYFIRKYVYPIKEDMYVVANKKGMAKLGGAGLGLVALSNLYPEYADMRLLRGLGKFIVFMQLENGSFYSKYDIKTKEYSDFASLYYPGEAALGLLYLYEVDKDNLWLDSAKKALLHIAQENLDHDDMIFDHWMLIATRKLFETPDNGLTAEETLTLKNAARKIANNVIRHQITRHKDPYAGAFVYKDNMNNVSTIVEGLSAAYYVVDDELTKNKIRKAVRLSTKYLDAHQVKNGELIGGIPARPDWKTSLKKSHGEIRIDNVQHFLGAWLTSKGIR